MVNRHRIEFPGTEFGSIDLPEHASLAFHLTLRNSPIRFGCRIGVCGTCLVEAEPAAERAIEPPDEAERGILALYVRGNPRARLACQLALTTSLRIRKL